MAYVERRMPAPPGDVFAVLADGWTYSDWVVGTAHIRDVDPGWPQPGTRIHHSVGPWPLMLSDTSLAVEADPPHRLLLEVGIWPYGRMHVLITIRDDPAGGSVVGFREDITGGPLVAARNKINDLLLHRRNAESLRRLADLAARRAGSRT